MAAAESRGRSLHAPRDLRSVSCGAPQAPGRRITLLLGCSYGLSYGEQKLLTVGRVLATGAELLLLDEPASGLSAGALDAVMALRRRLQSEAKTLLAVAHDTRVVQQIADQVVFLHQGHVMAEGSPAEIITDPALAEIYFGGAV